MLDLPADERLEATLATTALAIAAGVDIVRVHDVRANVRAARMADAIVRGDSADGSADREGTRMTDRIVLRDMRFEGRHGVCDDERLTRSRSRSTSSSLVTSQPAGIDDDLERTVDYGRSTTSIRQIVESTSFRLLEAIAEAIARERPRRLRRSTRSSSGSASRRSGWAARSTTRASRSGGSAPDG